MTTIVPIEKTASFNQMISQASNIAILSHTHPDGDAIGSTTAMWHYLTAVLGKKAVILKVEDVPDNLKFIREGSLETEDATVVNDCDLLVVLDLNCLERLPDTLKETVPALKTPKILIDHHLAPKQEQFDLVISDPKASSACELLYFLLKEANKGISSFPMPLLSALMSGMTTDTNNFDNSVRPETLTMTSELLGAGVDRETILDNLNRSNRANKIQAFSYFLGQKLVLKDKLAYIVMTEEELDRYDLQSGELEGLVNIPLTIGQIKVSITAKQENGYWRISMRSKKGYTVNLIAADHFGGGGHAQASGGRLCESNGFETPDKVAKYIEQVVRI